MPELPERLRAALRDAMKARDTVATSALRSALSAIDNATAVTPTAAAPESGSGPLAGAVTGLGAGEAPRRHLTEVDVRALVEQERDERLAAADDYVRAGRANAAARLRAEADVLHHQLTLGA